MELAAKVKHVGNWLDSIARSDALPVPEIHAALDLVIAYAQAAKATAADRPREVPKMAIGTDEAAILEHIRLVREAIAATADEGAKAKLARIEAALGAMLPPVRGTLTIRADDVANAGAAP